MSLANRRDVESFGPIEQVQSALQLLQSIVQSVHEQSITILNIATKITKEKLEFGSDSGNIVIYFHSPKSRKFHQYANHLIKYKLKLIAYKFMWNFLSRIGSGRKSRFNWMDFYGTLWYLILSRLLIEPSL